VLITLLFSSSDALTISEWGNAVLKFGYPYHSYLKFVDCFKIR